MARRLLVAGHDVHVWNRTRAKAEDLVAHGATVVDAVGDLAESRRRLHHGRGGSPTCWRSPWARTALLRGTTGTGAPRRLQHRVGARPPIGSGCAPPSAAPFCSPPRSAATPRWSAPGRLSIAVSGPGTPTAVEDLLLALIGSSVTYVGEGDVARLVKLAHNVLLGVVTQSLAEITVLAERGGVSRAAFLEFMNGSVLGSTFTRYKTPALVNLDFTPTFTTELLRKDFDLGLAAARALEVPMPVAAATHQLVQARSRPRPPRRGLRGPAARAGAQRRDRAEPKMSTSTTGCRQPDDPIRCSRRCGSHHAVVARDRRAQVRNPRPRTDQSRPDGRRLRGAGRLRPVCAPTGWPAHAPRSTPPSSARVLLFDVNNIRYVSATMIGEWARDKVARYALLTRWWRARSSGTSARPRATTSSTRRGSSPRTAAPGMLGLRGAVAPDAGLDRRARWPRSVDALRRAGVAGTATRRRHRRAADDARAAAARARRRDGQQVMLDARLIKSARRDHAAVDGRGDGRRRLPGHRRGAQAGRARKRDRRAGQQAPLRDGF